MCSHMWKPGQSRNPAGHSGVDRTWRTAPQCRYFLTALIDRIDVGANQIDIRLRPRRLSALLDIATSAFSCGLGPRLNWDLLKSFSWGISALRQLFASDDGAISSPSAPYHLPVPREIALRSRSGLARHLGSLALRRRGPDWNGRPTAKAWVPHREEIPRSHPSMPTASLRSDVFGLGASLPTCRPAPTPAEKPGRCRRVSTGDIERIFRQA